MWRDSGLPDGLGVCIYTTMIHTMSINTRATCVVRRVREPRIHPKVKLVEPFLVYTIYGVSLGSGDKEWLARENNVRLSDIIDINDWKRLTQQRQYAEMATWEDFLENAPRHVILVQNQFSLCNPQSLEKKFSPFFKLFQF